MTSKILVLGGAGYIGSTMVPHLLHLGYQVMVVDNLMFGQIPLLDCCRNKKFDFVKGDICNTSWVNSILPKYDVVIPLAAIVGAPACKINPPLTTLVNLQAHMNLVKNISVNQMVIFPTTNSGYGIGEKDSFCTENSPLRPISEYGKMKVEVEAAFLERGNSITFRLATVFGVSPRMRIDLLVNNFVHRAVYDKFIVLFEEHFRRNYIHVKDVANAFSFGIDHYDTMRGEPFNVGLTSANLTKRELCEKIKQYIPDFYIHSSEIGSDPDQRDYMVSNEKLESCGWSARQTLDDGIEELIKGYRLIQSNEFQNV